MRGAAARSRGLKATTGIVGLEVDPHARETVQTKAEAVLDAVKVIDANVQYRKNVEATFGFWLKQARALLALHVEVARCIVPCGKPWNAWRPQHFAHGTSPQRLDTICLCSSASSVAARQSTAPRM